GGKTTPLPAPARRPPEVVEELEPAPAYGTATWLPSGDARRNDPEQRDREQDADRQSKAAATPAWLSAPPQTSGQRHGGPPDAPTLFASHVAGGLAAPANASDQGQRV